MFASLQDSDSVVCPTFQPAARGDERRWSQGTVGHDVAQDVRRTGNGAPGASQAPAGRQCGQRTSRPGLGAGCRAAVTDRLRRLQPAPAPRWRRGARAARSAVYSTVLHVTSRTARHLPAPCVQQHHQHQQHQHQRLQLRLQLRLTGAGDGEVRVFRRRHAGEPTRQTTPFTIRLGDCSPRRFDMPEIAGLDGSLVASQGQRRLPVCLPCRA